MSQVTRPLLATLSLAGSRLALTETEAWRRIAPTSRTQEVGGGPGWWTDLEPELAQYLAENGADDRSGEDDRAPQRVLIGP